MDAERGEEGGGAAEMRGDAGDDMRGEDGVECRGDMLPSV